MHEIQSGLLLIGHALDIREPKPLFDAGIEAVVDVAYEEPPARLPRQMIYCRFPLNDGGGNAASTICQAVQTLVDLLASETPTIVACSAGMSRSPTIAAFGLAVHLGLEPEDALAKISETKALEINGVLWNDVAKVLPQVRRPQ